MHSRFIELVQYADDTGVVAIFMQPTLLVKYRLNYLEDLEKWLRNLKIAVNTGKRAAALSKTM